MFLSATGQCHKVFYSFRFQLFHVTPHEPSWLDPNQKEKNAEQGQGSISNISRTRCWSLRGNLPVLPKEKEKELGTNKGRPWCCSRCRRLVAKISSPPSEKVVSLGGNVYEYGYFKVLPLDNPFIFEGRWRESSNLSGGWFFPMMVAFHAI